MGQVLAHRLEPGCQASVGYGDGGPGDLAGSGDQG